MHPAWSLINEDKHNKTETKDITLHLFKVIRLVYSAWGAVV